MRGATSATAGSQKWPSSASSHPRRGTTSESRNATKSVLQAVRPVLRAAAGPLLLACRSTWTSQCRPEKSWCCTGTAEPSSTMMTRIPRSAASSRRRPETLSRTGITTVTSRCEGPVAGRGCATVASSSVRASCALRASWTSKRPPLSMVWAAGARRSSRVGEPPSNAEPSPSTLTRRSTCTANPSGSRGPVMSASRHGRRPPCDRCAHPSTISANIRAALFGRRRGRVTENPELTHRCDPALAHSRASVRPGVSGCRAGARPARHPVAKYVAIQTFRCGRRARRRSRPCRSTSRRRAPRI